ncbi:hypothetical protein [Fervidibacillus halotolerans]|uniref:Coupling factor for flagellin transcription and translation n=1 Tax=Fervidibacillus halotolerans TaxID=2980027 RepID=A0A9E8M1L4_9BACI|nr:hypothetical protein [Fervidibacillus halotolerans]WAA13579.1 hypothetical protein OE105_05600 [Fervidibacillus halotolerans]
MMDFLMVVNFILVIFAFFLIILLFLRQNRYHDLEKKFERLNREMEEMISSFLIEMKEENDQFLGKLRQLKKQQQPFDGRKEEGKYEKHIGNERKELEEDNESKEKKSSSKQASPPVHDESVQTIKEHDRLLNDVKQLLESGYTVEEIAKQLKKGKTEIELLIKFTPSLFKIAEAASREKREA